MYDKYLKTNVSPEEWARRMKMRLADVHTHNIWVSTSHGNRMEEESDKEVFIVGMPGGDLHRTNHLKKYEDILSEFTGCEVLVLQVSGKLLLL